MSVEKKTVNPPIHPFSTTYLDLSYGGNGLIKVRRHHLSCSLFSMSRCRADISHAHVPFRVKTGNVKGMASNWKN